MRTTPKVVGGLTEDCTEAAAALYGEICDEVVRVSGPEPAELTKLLENIFRSVNIALVNELSMLCERLGIDIWEVIDAASTKPFGFMRFEPGPGMGGHCLPVDPFYLAYKAREQDFYTEFIELAGKINQNQPHFCVERIEHALNDVSKPMRGSKILLLGVSYKAGVGDIRESPALKIIKMLQRPRGRGRLPRPPRPLAARVRARLRRVRRGNARRRPGLHRHRPPRGRPRPGRRRGAAGARLPRHHARQEREQRRETLMATAPRTSSASGVGVVGLGYWGPNIARNLDALEGCELAWCCDADEASRARYGAVYPDARFTADFDELLADESLDAVAITTPVPTHAELADPRPGGGQALLRREAARPGRGLGGAPGRSWPTSASWC